MLGLLLGQICCVVLCKNFFYSLSTLDLMDDQEVELPDVYETDSPIDDNLQHHLIETQNKYKSEKKSVLFIVCISIFIVLSILYLILFIMWTQYPSGTCPELPDIYLDEIMAKQVVMFTDDAFGKFAINHLQLLGTHNSYHIEPLISFSSTFKYSHESLPTQLDRGVRHLEIDGHFDRKTQRWEVYHLAIIDANSNCGKCLCGCLQELKQWSNRNNNHTVIIVWIEPKTILNYQPFCIGNNDSALLRIEREILSVFPLDKIIVPDQVKGNFSTLREAIINRGWPSVEISRGKFIFVFNFWSENQHCKQYYDAKKHPLLFSRVNDETDDNAAFMEMDNANDRVLRLLKWNYFIRTGVGKDPMRIKASVDSGAQLLATDFFDAYLPKFTRCNPMLTQRNCTIVNP